MPPHLAPILAGLIACIGGASASAQETEARSPSQPTPVQIAPLRPAGNQAVAPAIDEPITADSGLIEVDVAPMNPAGKLPEPTIESASNSASDSAASGASSESVLETPPGQSSAARATGNLPADAAENGGPAELTVSDLIASVYSSFPEISAARQQANVAQGEVTESWGAYDLKLKAFSLSEPTGFYRNYRNGIGVARQTWWGGQVAAGYRIGRGLFQPWYLERETEKGGEFKLSLIQPLLQGRAIDPQRFELFRASLALRAADPILQEAVLLTSRDATVAYWNWVAMGATLQAQRELLALAVVRGEQYEVGVKAGKFAEIDLILNQQLIAERRGTVIEAERKFQEASFKLSVFLRDAQGAPLIPPLEWLPTRFPTIEPLSPDGLNSAIAIALSNRPEPRLLAIEIQKLQWERCLARNQTLPRLDFVVEGSKDVGAPASKSDDKGPFELVIGAAGEVPIQRRKAFGKIQSLTGKIAQVDQKLRLQRDKISIEVRTAYNNLLQSAELIEQATLALQAAIDTLDRYRFAFERGKVDLIYLNLLETKTNETEIKLIDAQQKWFDSLARFQAASGFDPLEQAALVTALPPSDRPGPGRLPDPKMPPDTELEKDWNIHSDGAPQP